ncbi:SusD-like starch-binding protein associating with outer membrane [Mucilaginibacter gracilis]|uniref:SusD-like starch-binding protein associating with outer membrane n=1 Tax=Mucilaginibacter gracilis TaxID=423350 RepID=A0A495J3H7_9SPHI|nr:RagB/SusD family nutrient uptake outer membrane protein [Mucilaginibacter gracilis]RKR82928.1 SusD-like starch-binding protein associating with outer membrane [Mucilaginibacter gracilis]
MKKYRYILSMAVLLFCSLISCKKDFLSVVPLGKQVAVTTSDYGLIMNNQDMYLANPTGGWAGPALMGDDVSAEATYFNSAQARSQQAFKWGDDIYQPSDTPTDLRNWITNLYLCNKVINEVMSSTGGTAQQKSALQAEARASRAWLYFQFVNYYGKPYKASTAATDPAFPIITTADVTANGYSRNSVQEVYDFIVNDLTTAIPNLPVQNTSATRFARPAAEGLLGKVYLFMNNGSAALTQITAALTDNAAATTPARLYDYNKEFAVGGKFYPITTNGPTNSPEVNYTDVTESVLAYTFFNGNYNGNSFGSDFIVLSPQAVALFAPSDLRLNFYTAHYINNVVNPSGRLAKYKAFGTPYAKYGLQISELYLLSAEAKARLNNLSGAETDIETLRKCRMPVANATVPAAIVASQPALLQYIFDEREREFATQGYRWFDMRRISVDPLLTAPTYNHILYNDATSTNTTIYPLSPVRLTQRLSPYIMLSNPQFTDNP